MGKLLKLPLLSMVLAACSNGTVGNQIKPTPISWQVAGGDSQLYAHRYKNSDWADRCWRSSFGLDCLSVFSMQIDADSITYSISRYHAKSLPTTDVELSDLRPGNGYACQISTKLGLATETVPGLDKENNVSLFGEEPIGRPLSREFVDTRLHRLHSPNAFYFDCVELGGRLIAHGMSAIVDDQFNLNQLG